LHPSYFADLRTLIVPTLGIIMFGMGVTLTTSDFKRVLLRPKDVGVGVVTQYGAMPFLGFALAKIFGLDPMLAAGVVLVGSCPGGTSSNVITYLARGDVAFSVTMTSVSTLISPITIPLLMYVYAGHWIDVPVFKLFLSTVQIILLPVALGLGVRTLVKDKISYVLPILPSVSSIAIIFIVGVIVAANSGSIATVGLTVTVIAVLHNILGFSIGYGVARLYGMDVIRARAVSIEIGMQNSGLAVALANTYFGTLAALPGAIFSVWMNISGSVLAWWWRRSSN
jgi:BASS family bile acid:Na+ symporter